ncbi:MAG: Glutathione-regulated potassium-efflux system protein KefB [Chthoniobacteraceae bacterium]|nr:Glutathione-regulated potassium-efflux system protein KefB [Chthoniobacteraceae bacterium]
MNGALFQSFIYLAAAISAVPLAKRFGLGSVLGYLLAGVIIGPYLLGLVGGGGDVMHFAEFGVVMMLFLIGLELRPAMLWRMRGPILGLGGLQVTGTAAVLGLGALCIGLPWKPALAVGLILAMSSTAIVLQSLGEKGLLKTPGGEACFAVLLFQDIAVIPILALMPLLAGQPNGGGAAAHGDGLIANLPGWQQALLVIAAVAAIVFAGRFLLRPFFRYIADTRLRELFTATALLIVIGIALVMQQLGLSPALGTFIAGVVLAESEYRVQLEADIEPFKGLLLGLFFISVGATIDFSLMARQPGVIALLVAGLLLCKFAVLFVLGRKFKANDNFLFAFALAQGGEFAFVLFSFATQQAVLAAETSNLLISAVALSMAAAPLLLVINEKLVQPRLEKVKPRREADEIDEHDNPVILAGVGRFGHIIGRVLRANGFPTTVLDHDADQVEMLRQFGLKSFYGDASRLDLLHAAGAERAKLFILAIDDEVKSLAIIKMVQLHFPRLKILARATSRQHAYELLRLNVSQVYRETLGSALYLSVDALLALGMEEPRARRAAEIFHQHDEASMRDMAHFQGDTVAYASRARQHMENLASVMQSDLEMPGSRHAVETEK